MTRPRLTVVSSHVRRLPQPSPAFIAKTADLYLEVHGDHMTKLLHDALDMMDLSDIQADRIRETY